MDPQGTAYYTNLQTTLPCVKTIAFVQSNNVAMSAMSVSYMR